VERKRTILSSPLGFKKKGFIGDVAYIVISFFVMAIVIIAIRHAINGIEPMLNSTDTFNDSTTMAGFENVKTRYVNLTDGVALVLLVGLAMTSILLVVFLDTHPAFFWITLFILVFIAIIGGFLANAYQSITVDTALSESASEFTIIPYVFTHYVQIILGIGGMVLIAMFVKGRSQT